MARLSAQLEAFGPQQAEGQVQRGGQRRGAQLAQAGIDQRQAAGFENAGLDPHQAQHAQGLGVGAKQDVLAVVDAVVERFSTTRARPPRVREDSKSVTRAPPRARVTAPQNRRSRHR
jgi:hypothetical protein